MNPAALVDAYLDRVYRFLLALVGDTEMARDLTQETFLRLQRGGPHPDPAGPGLAYVFATARNTAISHLRRRSLEERHLSPLPPEEIDALARPEPAQGPAALFVPVCGRRGVFFALGISVLRCVYLWRAAHSADG